MTQHISRWELCLCSLWDESKTHICLFLTLLLLLGLKYLLVSVMLLVLSDEMKSVRMWQGIPSFLLLSNARDFLIWWGTPLHGGACPQRVELPVGFVHPTPALHVRLYLPPAECGSADCCSNSECCWSIEAGACGGCLEQRARVRSPSTAANASGLFHSEMKGGVCSNNNVSLKLQLRVFVTSRVCMCPISTRVYRNTL